MTISNKLRKQLNSLHTKLLVEVEKWFKDEDADTGDYKLQNGTYLDGYMQALKDISKLNGFNL